MSAMQPSSAYGWICSHLSSAVYCAAVGIMTVWLWGAHIISARPILMMCLDGSGHVSIRISGERIAVGAVALANELRIVCKRLDVILR